MLKKRLDALSLANSEYRSEGILKKNLSGKEYRVKSEELRFYENGMLQWMAGMPALPVVEKFSFQFDDYSVVVHYVENGQEIRLLLQWMAAGKKTVFPIM